MHRSTYAMGLRVGVGSFMSNTLFQPRFLIEVVNFYVCIYCGFVSSSNMPWEYWAYLEKGTPKFGLI